ncbi:MAG: hypothetical protein PVI54_19760, partial [Desulfobacteraceae bacterium]
MECVGFHSDVAGIAITGAFGAAAVTGTVHRVAAIGFSLLRVYGVWRKAVIDADVIQGVPRLA